MRMSPALLIVFGLIATHVGVGSAQDCPELIGQDATIGAKAVTASGGYAYVGNGAEVIVMDVSTPAAPFEVTRRTLAAGQVRDLAVAGDYLYVAGDTGGLRIYDVSNPAAPDEVGFDDTAEFAWGVDVAGDYAYVGDLYAGLRVVNVSNPSAPYEVGYLFPLSRAHKVVVVGDYAYIAGWSAGLRVVNVSNPSIPVLDGFYDTPGYAFDVTVVGDHAFIADHNEGLRVIDIQNPLSPQEVGFFTTTGDADWVDAVGTNVYLVDYHESLWVVNTLDPVFPTEAGYFDTPGSTEQVAIDGEHVYVADGTSGLEVFLQCPEPLIFANGFESGDTSAWSQVVPQKVPGAGVFEFAGEVPNQVFVGSRETKITLPMNRTPPHPAGDDVSTTAEEPAELPRTPIPTPDTQRDQQGSQPRDLPRKSFPNQNTVVNSEEADRSFVEILRRYLRPHPSGTHNSLIDPRVRR